MKRIVTKKLFAVIAFVLGVGLMSSAVLSQEPVLADKNLKITSTGDLKITPSETSSPNDFDWYAGNWKIHNRKLKTRLNNSHEWTEFEATDEAQRILNGTGFINYYKTNTDGKPFAGMSLTLFNPETKLWSIYWADGDSGVMDPVPLIGSFEGGIGTFYAKDVWNGKNIIVKTQWDATDPDKATWSQAFSPDNGKTWEWNWYMSEERVKENMGSARRMLLKPDPSLEIPHVNFDENGELKITASATSSARDFDFLVGKWKMYHRRLNKRLENSTEWTEFESFDESHEILNNAANTDIYYTTEMPGQRGKPFEGITVRLFNPKTRLWSLYWAASNTGVLDPPVVGSFVNGIRYFFTKDTFNGKKIIVLFRWDVRNKDKPVWGQAFSTDNGKTWEWNWFNILERIE